MILKTKHGRISIYVDGTGPDDLYLTEAEWVDADDPVSEETLREIERDHYGEMEFAWLERQIDRAETLAEGMER